MNHNKLHKDFAFCVRCESTSAVVFVACPTGGRFGDVRKTLAALLQRPFNSLALGPIGMTDASVPVEPYDDSQPVPIDDPAYGGDNIYMASILFRNENGVWARE